MTTIRKLISLILFLKIVSVASGNTLPTDTLSNDSKSIDSKKGALFQSVVIYYQTGDYLLTKSDEDRILKSIADMKDKTTMSFVISGYTDPAGSSGYNQHLSEMRIKMVKEILIGQGIAVSRVIENAFGESKSENLMPKDYHNMRKVEIKPIIMME